MATCRNDDTWGPVVEGCRGDFDFTQKFQRVMFSVVPAALFIPLALFRIISLARRRRITKGSLLPFVKICAIAVYDLVLLSNLIFVSVADAAAVRGLTIAGISFALTAGLLMMAVSWLEHTRSPRTSILLNTFLLVTGLLEIAQARSLWLSGTSPYEIAFSCLFTTSLAVKVLMLTLEGYGKSGWLDWDAKKHSPEETSGFYSLSVFFWLKNLFFRGYKHVLRFDDLYALDRALSAEATSTKLTAKLNSQRGSPSLLKALGSAFTWQLLIPILPRMILIALNYGQTFFLQALLNFLDTPESQASKYTGYGLIAACGLLYFGIATSNSYASYYEERLASMIRACLCTAIYGKTTELAITTAKEAASITLMSTDVEHVEQGVRNLHGIWPNLINVGLSSWLLYTRLGITFVTPLVIIFICTALVMWVMTFVSQSQGRWMQKVESRVAFTTSTIANMKIFKMLGISEHVVKKVQQLRESEVRAGTVFRLFILATVALSFFPEMMSAPLTFALSFRELDTTTRFVALAFLTRITAPLTALFQGLPSIVSAMVSLRRIESYLAKEGRYDCRDWLESESQSAVSVNLPRTASDDDVELRSFPSNSERAFNDEVLPNAEHAFVIKDGSFGWKEDKMVLNAIDIIIPRGKTTIVVGPVASGKSTLCAALLGEIPLALGKLEGRSSSASVGYCAQTPYLTDGTVEENITGPVVVDRQKYEAVISATLLGPDLDQLSLGDQTQVGSNGTMLSGGQKQRVSLARTLFHKSEIMIFDDILSGLDASTETKVVQNMLGPNGLLRQWESTTVLCTHSIRHLPLADHIVVLGEGGVVVEQGSFDMLRQNGKYVSTLDLAHPDDNEQDDGKNDTDEKNDPNAPVNATNELLEAGRKSRDWSIYAYYFRAIPKLLVIGFMVLCAMGAVATNFSTVWLSYWSSDYFHQSKGTYLGIYALIGALGLLSMIGSIYVVMAGVVPSSGLRFHHQTINTLARAPLNFLTTTDTGTVTNLFSQDMNLIDFELPLALLNTVFGVTDVIASLFVASIASPYLAISYPFLLALLYAIQSFYLRTSRQMRLLDLEAKSPLYNHFINTISGLGTIRAFNWVESEISRNRQLLDASQRPAYLLSMIQAWLQTNLTIVVGIISTLLTVLVTQLRSSPSFTGASLIQLMSLTSSISNVVQGYTALETSIGAVNRLRTFTEKVTPEAETSQETKNPENWPDRGALTLCGVSASYSNEKSEEWSETAQKSNNLALNNISLSIQPRDKIAICGRSGSGKSSLLMLLLRFIDPLSTVEKLDIDGISLDGVHRSDLRSRIIAVPQDTIFIPGTSSIKENIDPLGEATEDECLSVLKLVNLASLVEECGGLDGEMTSDSLSAGQRQLFGLGRAVLRRRIKDKKEASSSGGILMLDEVNSNMDKDTEERMEAILRAEFGRYTIIMIAHRLSTVMKLCNRVIVLDKGSIVEEGNPTELAATPGSRFGELWLEHS